MLPVRSVLIDFDGTVCVDVTLELLTEFVDADAWAACDRAFELDEIRLREAIQSQNRMLEADRETLMSFALEKGCLEPTFPPFLRWCEAKGLEVAIVSDGFGFYIEPILAAAGLGHVRVITNEQVWRDGRPDGLRFINAHPACVGCGNCKIQAVMRYQERGPVAFIGDGQSDIYAAHYADLTFAKGVLASY